MPHKILSLITLTSFYTQPATPLLTQIRKPDHPAIATKISPSQKLKSTVTKADQKDLPKDVQDLLKKDAPDETRMGDATGKILPNTDLGIVPDAHYPYLIELEKAATEKKSPDSLSAATKIPAGTPAEPAQAVGPTKRKLTLFGTERQISPMKLLALLKSTHLDHVRKINDDPVTLCGSGHWIRVTDLEGDHAYPDSSLTARFFYVFGPDYDTKTHGDPLTQIPPVFQAQSPHGKFTPSKALFMAHYLDARNLMPLCKECNGNKNANYLAWFINHPQYGKAFILNNFPLNYSTIVPRTKHGEGLGDAAMTHLFTNHALRQSLFPVTVLAISEVAVKKESDEAAVGDQLQGAIAIVREAAKGKLGVGDQELLDVLLGRLGK